MSKKYWKDSFAYQRILEILEDYWLTEPDELAVHVELEFLKANGERQPKRIDWINPNYERINSTGIERFGDHIVSLADIKEINPEDIWKIKINPADYRKKENE